MMQQDRNSDILTMTNINKHSGNPNGISRFPNRDFILFPGLLNDAIDKPCGSERKVKIQAKGNTQSCLHKT